MQPFSLIRAAAVAPPATPPTITTFISAFRVNMKVRHEVTAIHPDKKTVSVKNLQTGEEFEESYDKLILSPGAKPTQPRLPGLGLDKLFTLRTVLAHFIVYKSSYIGIKGIHKLFWTLDNCDLHSQFTQVFCQAYPTQASRIRS